MKKSTKNIALLLAFLMAGSTLISCESGTAETSANPPEAPAAELESTPSAVDEITAEPEETRESHSLDTDALDFRGEEMVSAVYNWQGYLKYFFADELNGDIMNDAIYSRRLKVEEALNIKLTTNRYGEGEYVTEINKLFLAGDHAFDLMFNHCIQDIGTYVTSGYLYNLDTLPHINTAADWWDKEQMDNLRLGQNTYYAVNDMMIPAPYVITFNKDMIENNQLDNPYQLVYDGKWTLDTFTALAKAVARDMDGDGDMDRNDQWGLTQGGSSNISFMVGAGQFLTARDSDNRIILNMKTDKMQSIVEIFADLSAAAIFLTPKGEEPMTLNDNRALFDTCSLGKAEIIRDYDVNAGFLPYPKYDEAQSNYMNMDWGGLLSVSGLITNPDMVGAAMELLAWESANEVIPAYYDRILDGKLARDPNDRNMLDLIFDTIVYDNGANYFGFSGGIEPLFYSIYRLAILQRSTDYTSFYEKRERPANQSIATFYKALDKAEG